MTDFLNTNNLTNQAVGTATEFPLAMLFNAAFGISGVLRTFPEAKKELERQGSNINFDGIEIVSREEAIHMSYLGTPIVYPITFKSGNYKIYDATGKVVEKTMRDFRLPLATLVDFSRSKIKQVTRVVGSNSSVKEMYGHSDWQIRIRGLCLDDPKHPQGDVSYLEQHARILEWEELADSIAVDSDLFKERSVYRIDINSINLPQIQGKPRVLPFELACESDTPLELILV